jgi:hypothetical protein
LNGANVPDAMLEKRVQNGAQRLLNVVAPVRMVRHVFIVHHGRVILSSRKFLSNSAGDNFWVDLLSRFVRLGEIVSPAMDPTESALGSLCYGSYERNVAG